MELVTESLGRCDKTSTRISLKSLLVKLVRERELNSSISCAGL
jgi:hypothetical protein